jgi:hypothetical protein
MADIMRNWAILGEAQVFEEAASRVAADCISRVYLSHRAEQRGPLITLAAERTAESKPHERTRVRRLSEQARDRRTYGSFVSR